jgi:hypothetical protein
MPTTNGNSLIVVFREAASAASRILGIEASEGLRREVTNAIARAGIEKVEGGGGPLSELEARAIVAAILRREIGLTTETPKATSKATPKGAA